MHTSCGISLPTLPKSMHVQVICGAGMMAIPKAFFLLGLPLGMLTQLMVGLLAFATLSALITASTKTGSTTFGGLTRTVLGPSMGMLLSAAVFFICWTMEGVHSS